MSMIGLIGLFISFIAVAVSVLGLAIGHLTGSKSVTWASHIAALLGAAGLTFCCGLLLFCFLTGDYSIQYVLNYRSDAEGTLGWLYKVSGLWGGRAGSLLFWAWLISLFNAVVALRNIKAMDKLDNLALLVSQLVLLAFVAVTLFSEQNQPFIITDATWIDTTTGQPSAEALLLTGMSPLLEHWAMAIHPPTLFLGYAGLTIPFAYAISALLNRDFSKKWVLRCQRYALVSWLFLGLGIGLGAVWAYVELTFGGYWAWDAVENASLLSWIMAVALVHSLTVYRQRDSFKAWALICACVTMAFVILGTYITRSGRVASVHAFAADAVSEAVFLTLVVAPVLVGCALVFWRRKQIAASQKSPGSDEMESMASRDAMYFLNNVFMLLAAVILAYMTLAPALPQWLPYGGVSLGKVSYNFIARPLCVLYLAVVAICPLLSWGKTQGKAFWRKARLPGALALLVFALLLGYFVLRLAPVYQSVLAAGGDAATELTDSGPMLLYYAITIVGFLVASLLFFNSVFMLRQAVQAKVKRGSQLGGFLAHLAMAVILVGLIGSAMYVQGNSARLASTFIGSDGSTIDTFTIDEDISVADYTLKYVRTDTATKEDGNILNWTIVFDVYQGDKLVGQVAPSFEGDPQKQAMLTALGQDSSPKYMTSVLSLPTEDIFVMADVPTATGENGEYTTYLSVKVFPLVNLVWFGFALLMLGTALAALMPRQNKPRKPTGTENQ
ncbi:MAG: cytochrome c biogenesis protein CcsA [Coriobacteriales bacterium]|jgi:cytochrome c-type biogenesis protein CcmF|nr:cytochrome c biogenesis protein CcsA [Coriobacteriales bacterium]